MSNGTGPSAYQHTRVLSSSPEQLVPLLYERLLADLRRAAAHIAAQEIEAKSVRLQNASAIVFELLAALDMEAGGELANRLAALYLFFASEIAEIGRTLDPARLAKLIDMVAMLHGSWVQAAAAFKADPAARGRKSGNEGSQ